MPTPERILIVEDEDILADNLKVFLSRRSPDVRIAPDAETAVEMLKSFTPDLLVLDYALPGADGFSAYNAIVSSTPEQPGCVMITGYLTDMLADNARQQGIRHLLCKPFSFAELQDAIDLSAEEKTTASAPGNRRAMERRSEQIDWQANRRSLTRRSQL